MHETQGPVPARRLAGGPLGGGETLGGSVDSGHDGRKHGAHLLWSVCSSVPASSCGSPADMGRQGSDPGPSGPCVRAGTAVTLGSPEPLVPLCGRRKVMERVIITGVDRSAHSRASATEVGGP
ncbi:hypothetical protein GCM10010321_02690 [Streptomyces chartreusis]|nr:hypothetical protein GCM10010321_02690 [Streptomyces chartreusis]